MSVADVTAVAVVIAVAVMTAVGFLTAVTSVPGEAVAMAALWVTAEAVTVLVADAVSD